MKLPLKIFGVGLCATLVTACGGTSTASDDGALEQTEISVGALALADYAAAYWAADHGQFESEGLEVTLEPLQGGPVGIQKVATGELDFSITNAISLTLAIAEGMPVKSSVLSSGIGPDSQLVVVKEDSPIQDLADLDGQTFGVNTTNNMGDVMFEELAETEGLAAQPEYIEVPFNEMALGVQSGSIDAGYVPEPFASAAKEEGLRVVGDLGTGPNEDLPAANFITSTQFAAENPNTTAAFNRAMYAAGLEISQSEQEFRDWLPTVAELPEGVAQTMALPVFYAEMDESRLQGVADTLHRQGRIEEPITMADHIVPSAAD